MSNLNPGTIFCADGHAPIHFEEPELPDREGAMPQGCPLCRAENIIRGLRATLDRKELEIFNLYGWIEKLESKLDNIRQDRE